MNVGIAVLLASVVGHHVPAAPGDGKEHQAGPESMVRKLLSLLGLLVSLVCVFFLPTKLVFLTCDVTSLCCGGTGGSG